MTPTDDDPPRWTPHVEAAALRSTPGERLFEFQRGAVRFVCELRQHASGCEAQFFRNDEFLHSRTFGAWSGSARQLAIAWAGAERKRLEGRSSEQSGE